MKSEVRVCPNCEARNKAKWEFCVRCGESLQGVNLGEPLGAETGGDGAVAVTLDSDEGPPFPWRGILLAALGMGAIVFALKFKASDPVAPGLFSVGTMPAAVPALPAPHRAGEADYQQGVVLLSQGDGAGALVPLGRAVEAAPQNALYFNTYGRAYWLAGRRQEALGPFEVAVRLDPSASRFRLDWAAALEEAGRPGDAITVLEEGLSRNSEDTAIVNVLGRMQARRDPARALVLLRAAVEKKPNDLQAQTTLAMALEKSGDVKGALDIYRQVLDRVPDYPLNRGLMAEALYKQGQKDEAVALLRDGLSRESDTPFLHRTLGSLLERSGKYAEAIAEYREFARLAPNSADGRQAAERAAYLESKLSPS